MSGSFGSAPVVFLLLLGLFAIALTSFLSAVEIALGRLSRAFVQDLVEEGNRRAPQLLSLVEHQARTEMSLRGARVALQTTAIVSITIALIDLLSDWNMSWWGMMLVALASIGVIEFLAVSLLPAFLVARNYVAVALAGTSVTTGLVRLSHLFDPLIRVAAGRRGPSTESPSVQRLLIADDLREIVDEVGEPDSIDEDDKEMLRSVFEFGQTLVREVMVPRTSMITVNADTSLEKALSVFIRSGFSRVPVVGDDIDDVVGIAYFKDAVQRYLDTPQSREQPVRNIARPPVFIPEMRLADDELRAMQSESSHLALAVDEYGGISGLVTMEDLLEELVGELKDEHDRYEMEPEEIEPGVWRVPARFSLNDLEELLDCEIEEDSVDSVGGLLSWALGQVPLPGAEVDTHGLHLRADEAIGRRHEVVSVVVRRPVTDNGGSATASPDKNEEQQ